MFHYEQHGHRQKYTFNPRNNKSWAPAFPSKFGQVLKQKVAWAQGRSPRMMHNPNYYETNTEVYNQPQYANRGVGRPYNKKRMIYHETNAQQIKRQKFAEQGGGGLTNPAFDPFHNNVTVARHTLNTIQENDQEIEEEMAIPQQKRKKTKINNDQQTEVIGETPKQKKKKIKKSNVQEAEDTGEITKQKKKMKKSNDQETEEIGEVTKQKKKKKMKSGEQEIDESGEVQKQKKKKKTGVENPNFVLNAAESDIGSLDATKNFEVKRKIKKAKQSEMDNGIVNVALDLSDETVQSPANNALEVTRKRNDCAQGLDNPNFNVSDGDIMLNVTANAVEQAHKNELFDINTNVVANKVFNSHVNRAFRPRAVHMRHYTHFARRAIDNCQAEVENDFNEIRNNYPTVGETNADPNGENEKLSDGTKLKYKYASFTQKTPWYHMKAEGPKKSYKHLIKGDIVLAFKNTNLHEIRGYGVTEKNNQKQTGAPRVKRVSTLATSLRHTAVVKPTRMTVAGVRKPATYVTRRRMVPRAPTTKFRYTTQFATNYAQPFVKPRRLVNWHRQPTTAPIRLKRAVPFATNYVQPFVKSGSLAQWHKQNKLRRKNQQQNYGEFYQDGQQENSEGNQQQFYQGGQQENFAGNQQEYFEGNQQQCFEENQQQYFDGNQQQYYGEDQQQNFDYNQEQFFAQDQQQNFAENQYEQQQYSVQNQPQQYFQQKPRYKQHYSPKQQHFTQTQHYSPAQGTPVMRKRFVRKSPQQFTNYAMNHTQMQSNFVKNPMRRVKQPGNYGQAPVQQYHFQNQQQQFAGYDMNQAAAEYY